MAKTMSMCLSDTARQNLERIAATKKISFTRVIEELLGDYEGNKLPVSIMLPTDIYDMLIFTLDSKEQNNFAEFLENICQEYQRRYECSLSPAHRLEIPVLPSVARSNYYVPLLVEICRRLYNKI